MTEKATFCPRCRKMHVGICDQPPARFSIGGRVTTAGTEQNVPVRPRIEVAREAQAKFDKVAYQREYMRKRRAKAKAP